MISIEFMTAAAALAAAIMKLNKRLMDLSLDYNRLDHSSSSE